MAVMQCTQTMLSMGGTGRCIKICSDNQAAIKVGAPIVALQLALDCRQAPEALPSVGNKVTLLWTSNHSGIKGNEKTNIYNWPKTTSKIKLLLRP